MAPASNLGEVENSIANKLNELFNSTEVPLPSIDGKQLKYIRTHLNSLTDLFPLLVKSNEIWFSGSPAISAKFHQLQSLVSHLLYSVGEVIHLILQFLMYGGETNKKYAHHIITVNSNILAVQSNLL